MNQGIDMQSEGSEARTENSWRVTIYLFSEALEWALQVEKEKRKKAQEAIVERQHSLGASLKKLSSGNAGLHDVPVSYLKFLL